MRDLVPEEDEDDDGWDEAGDMMKHSDRHHGYATPNYVTVIPVEYPRSDGSPLSVGSFRSAEERELVLERHSPYVPSVPYLPAGRRLPPPPQHRCHLLASREDAWRPSREPPPPQPRPPAKKHEVCVYLLNRVCLCVEVEDMANATAEEIVSLIVQDDAEMNFPAQVAEVFALWMTSPLLELQLKPHHRPYAIRERWSDYLKKYTFATTHELDSDEPVLTFQRNVFFDKNEEKKITDVKMLKMLYAEAKENVLDGRYPCETDDCMILAAIQARLELGPYDPHKHTPEFFRSRIREFLPEHACKSHWFLLGLGAKNGPERRLAEKYAATPANAKDYRLLRKYLEFCWALPYYGCAFFDGQMERPVSGLAALVDHYDLPVLVGVNREGVHIVDPGQPVVLMSLHYRQFSWDCALSAQPQNPDCLPCLFLQFQQPGQSETNIVQIFSKQAVLMDALISTIVEELKSRPSWSEDETDGRAAAQPEEEVQVPLTAKKIREEQGISGRMRKLSIAKFSSRGEYINSRGSLVFKADAGQQPSWPGSPEDASKQKCTCSCQQRVSGSRRR